MHAAKATLSNLTTKAPNLTKKKALLGFDGFVDKIVAPIDKRHGPGDQFEAIDNLTELGERIKAASNYSTNIELYVKQKKLGGNGPIMANGLISKGIDVHYIGALGYPTIHPVFEELVKQTNAISICNPGITHAVECTDGKVLLGVMDSLEQVTYNRIIEVMGEGVFQTAVNDVDLIGMLNWTMLPHLTELMNDFIEKTLKHLGSRDQRLFFFDLADPEKRSIQDLQTALQSIQLFQSYGSVTLGMNLKEARHVYTALGYKPKDEATTDELKLMADTIRQDMKISTTMIHPIQSGVCSTKKDTIYLDGYHTENPLVTTGGGDHFNAGFAMAQLLEMEATDCLRLGMASSGFYVRTGKSPGLADLHSFITQSES